MPSLSLNFSTGSIQATPPTNAHGTTQEAALYKTLYRTPQGTILAEDVSSQARLSAIYAANAVPGQQVITYTRASTKGNGNGNGAQRPPTAYTNQPPSYVRPGTPLQQWATERASQEQDHRRKKGARHHKRQLDREGGLQVALEARLRTHAAMTANKLDCRHEVLVKPKKDFKSGWKSAPTPMVSSECLGEEEEEEERPSKRVKLSFGQSAPPRSAQVPQRSPTPLPRQMIVLSNKPPAPVRPLTPIPQPSDILDCAATEFQPPRTPLPLHARLAEPTVPKKLDEQYHVALARLGSDYSAAFERWDAGMARTIPGYRESMQRRGWFAMRWDGPRAPWKVGCEYEGD